MGNEINRNIRWVDHQKGKLGYYLDDAGEAVLWDFIGNDPILYLPASLEEGQTCIYVSPQIPDEAFPSCKHTKLLIFDCRYDDWNVGCFVFQNCTALQSAIRLMYYFYDDANLIIEDQHGIRTGEFSFTDRNFAPKSLEYYDMSFDQRDFSSGRVERFINAANTERIYSHLTSVLKCHSVAHEEYPCSYTGILLDRYDSDRAIQVAARNSCDQESLAMIRQCWNSVKRGIA